MNPKDCCPLRVRRRSLEMTGWLVPAAILTLVPKCPVCLAVYVALGTGIGLSVTTASYLRIGLIVVCMGSIVYLGARSLRRAVPWSWRKTP